MSENKNKNSGAWLPLIGILLLGGGMWLGYLMSGHRNLSPAEAKLAQVFEIIENEYVDSVNLDSLVETTLPIFMSNLDPHSSYIPAKDLAKVNSELESSFGGVGVMFQIINDTLIVVEVVKNGPSEAAGILAGDRITKVDGKSIVSKDLKDTDVRDLLRGSIGSNVKLTVNRPGEKNIRNFTVTRGEIPSSSVDAQYMANDSIGYLKISKFAQNTYPEFIQALLNLKMSGAKGYIIDLRSNSGGLLESAILMANELLPPGLKIVETRGRNPKLNETIISDGTGAYPDANVIVMIDELSASSSEIFAAAVQDNDRGLIVGRRSFGKGLVQRPITLPDSSELRLTVQRYYTPSGRSIQKTYIPGKSGAYDEELMQRYENGEVFSQVDTFKSDENKKYLTVGGRTVYGGGGVRPDYHVAADTLGSTSYYMEVYRLGLLQKYAFEIADLNRKEFSKCTTVNELMSKLPSNSTLVRSFAQYAAQNGVPARWYYINKSSLRIVNTLKAWIANDILGPGAYYEVINRDDPTYLKAVELAKKGARPLDSTGR